VRGSWKIDVRRGVISEVVICLLSRRDVMSAGIQPRFFLYKTMLAVQCYPSLLPCLLSVVAMLCCLRRNELVKYGQAMQNAVKDEAVEWDIPHRIAVYASSESERERAPFAKVPNPIQSKTSYSIPGQKS
jgi:hypothetical protein